MPVIRPDQLDRAPPACKIAGFGTARFRRGEPAGLEVHFHDGDEVWFVIKGRLRVQSEGQEHVVGAGEALFTAAGHEHAILEVLEDTVVLWVEQDLRGRRRPGHLHHREDPWP
jgi:mannose-6-phosphate isomerase-like protein (cupin superfamily)